MAAIDEIATERRRQIEQEGYDSSHDDGHQDGALAWAAVCYAAPELVYVRDDRANAFIIKDPWPWDIGYDKRTYDGNVVMPTRSAAHRRELLVKAGALIAAEIDRLDRWKQ